MEIDAILAEVSKAIFTLIPLPSINFVGGSDRC
jgi:hypothetical protein